MISATCTKKPHPRCIIVTTSLFFSPVFNVVSKFIIRQWITLFIQDEVCLVKYFWEAVTEDEQPYVKTCHMQSQFSHTENKINIFYQNCIKSPLKKPLFDFKIQIQTSLKNGSIF